MPKVVGIIPARLESTRLPRKLLLDETGLPLIVHTIRQAKKAQVLDMVCVATDSPEIYSACVGECPVFLTTWIHGNGTSRCNEVINRDLIGYPSVVVNIQADEPEISPKVLNDLVVHLLDIDCDIATPVVEEDQDPCNLNLVKAIVNSKMQAIHFTRVGIQGQPRILRHVGVYAFREFALQRYEDMSESPYEKSESLEQLRFTWNGYRIAALQIDHAYPGINCRADYDAFRERYLSAQAPQPAKSAGSLTGETPSNP